MEGRVKEHVVVVGEKMKDESMEMNRENDDDRTKLQHKKTLGATLESFNRHSLLIKFK
ncbi:unnamed protein product, partial [Sphenostylis stenocarpa]